MSFLWDFGVGGGGSSPVISRAIASNRNMLPSTTQNTSNYVRHSRIKFTVPSNATYTNIKAYLPGFGQNAGGEFNSPDNQNVKASIEYGGAVYQSTSALITPSGGAWLDFTGLTLPPGATAIIVTRAVGANTGSVDRLIGQGVNPIFGEGAIVSTNTGQDYTNGVYGKDATANAPTVAGGNITACTVASGGTNYSGGPNVYAYEQQASGVIAWKTIGYANLTGAAVTSISITSGTPPSGVAAWVSPTVIIGNQFSSNTSVYGPALITGQPSVAAKSLAIHGTSIDIGWGSYDMLGDFKRNYGIVERGLNNRCGVFNLASPSQTYANYSNAATFPLTYALLTSLGSTITNSYIGGPTNDVLASSSKATIEGQVNTLKSFLTGIGQKVDFARLIPNTTSLDGWTTIPGQTEGTGFGAGGVAVNYNVDVSGQTLVSNTPGGLDPRAQYQDSGSTRKWSVSTVITDDGIHPNAVGAWLASNNAGWKNQFAVYS